MHSRIPVWGVVSSFLVVLSFVFPPATGTGTGAWAQPAPNQPILVVQDSGSSDPYQNFVPELLLTEGLNGFQTAQLSQLNQGFLNNYETVILPHLALSSSQATLFQNYV